VILSGKSGVTFAFFAAEKRAKKAFVFSFRNWQEFVGQWSYR
jgi:hypothetical protein